MSDESNIHLTPNELAWLSGGEKTGPAHSAPEGDRPKLEAHAATCNLCGDRLRAYRAVRAVFRNVVTSVVPVRTSTCPLEETWVSLAIGRIASADSEALIEHASTCDYCGLVLREATKNFVQPLSEEERRSISSLASASVKWQRELARRMTSGDNSSTILGRAPISWTRFGHLHLGWAALVIVCIIAVIGIVIWPRSTSLASVNDLIAQAYSQRRPFSLRISNARYGVLRQQRGQLTALDDPQSLKEAKVQIAKALLRNPNDAQWLKAKAEVDMIEDRTEAALNSLQAASEIAPKDSSILVDMAGAYFELPAGKGAVNTGTRTSTPGANADEALRLLNQVLTTNPRDAAALFNRAVIYQSLGRNTEAETDFQSYLTIDPGSDWATEVRSRVSELPKPQQ